MFMIFYNIHKPHKSITTEIYHLHRCKNACGCGGQIAICDLLSGSHFEILAHQNKCFVTIFVVKS